MYNLTMISEATTFLGYMQGVNHELEGFLGIFLLIIISSIAFISFYTNTRDPGASFAATSFISFGLSILLAAIELIAPKVLFITITATAASLAYSWQKNN